MAIIRFYGRRGGGFRAHWRDRTGRFRRYGLTATELLEILESYGVRRWRGGRRECAMPSQSNPGAMVGHELPVCQSEELSEEARFASFENHARFRDWEPGILQWKDLTVGAERARICVDCGYLMLFVGVADLAKLKAGRPRV